MKTLYFSIICIALSFSTFAQWDIKPPSLNEAKSKIENSAELKKQIEAAIGFPMNKLELKSDGWSGYQGSGFSLFYRDCGEMMYPVWPKDGCYTKFLVTGPKDSEGVYKMMGVYVDYKRSGYNGETCTLYNQWSYDGYRIESVQEYGYKEFNQEEAKNLLMNFLNSGKADVLNDFIEISSIDFENYGQSSASSGLHYLNFYFKGTKAEFTDDKTSIIGLDDSQTLRMSLQIEKVDGDWTGTKLGLYTAQMYRYEDVYNPENTEEKQDQMFATYGSGGFKSIYPNRTEVEKSDGELEKLESRINALLKIIQSKELELTAEDVADYFAPSNREASIEWFNTNYTNASKRRQLIEFSVEGGLPYKTTMNEKLVKVAFPELKAKFELYSKPKRKWEKVDRCSDCLKASSSASSTTYHPVVWVWENDNWYLLDGPSLFMERSESFDLSR